MAESVTLAEFVSSLDRAEGCWSGLESARSASLGMVVLQLGWIKKITGELGEGIANNEHLQSVESGLRECGELLLASDLTTIDAADMSPAECLKSCEQVLGLSSSILSGFGVEPPIGGDNE